jgi:sarcosine oxidase
LRFDVIVVGLGATGSAATYQLARRGAHVLGIDRHVPPHEFGSSHGDTRITRLAIGEGGHYTPLVMRSHALWRQIEHETGTELLNQCGGLIISSETKTSAMHVEGFFENTVAAAQAFGVSHELLDARAIRTRFPQFAVKDDEFAYFEPEAGFLRPEACIRSQLALARKYGAQIQTGEIVLGFDAQAGGVTVTTDRAVYAADRIVIAAGAWLPGFLGSAYAKPFKIFRQVLHWFDVDAPIAGFEPKSFPVFIWELQNSQQGIYGFPAIDGPGGGVKIATEQYDVSISPDDVPRGVTASEISDMYRNYVQPYLPALRARSIRTATCLYTVTPDAGFVIDHHPDSERVIVASPCSGHGFKHSPAIGEIVADMAMGKAPMLDMAPFSFSRFF